MLLHEEDEEEDDEERGNLLKTVFNTLCDIFIHLLACFPAVMTRVLSGLSAHTLTKLVQGKQAPLAMSWVTMT